MPKDLLNFIITSSLYSSIEIRIPEADQLFRIHDDKARFELFCPECGDKKVFVFYSGLDATNLAKLNSRLHSTEPGPGSSYGPSKLLDGINHLHLKFKCTLDESHILEYFFVVRGISLIKVGQYPSSGDIELPNAERYNKILGKQYCSELKRAIKLHSHGVGIGSFVYLRRIIEKLVYDTFKEAEAAGVITEQRFEYQEDEGKHRRGIEDKIKLLKGFLPDLITEHPKIYGVVSKGIHELSEDECLKYFPILKGGIILILDEIVAKKEKEKAADEYKKSLSSILSDI